MPLPLAIPIAQATTSIIGSTLSAINKHKLAKMQKQEAQKKLNEANGLVTPQVGDEYNDALKLNENKAINGMSGYNQMRDRLDQNMNNQLTQAKLSTNSSGDLLGVLSAMNNQKKQAENDLSIRDAEYKDGANKDIVSSKLAIANEKARLDALTRADKSKLREQANALENSSTANKFGGNDELIKNSTGAVSSMLGQINGIKGGDTKDIDNEKMIQLLKLLTGGK